MTQITDSVPSSNDDPVQTGRPARPVTPHSILAARLGELRDEMHRLRLPGALLEQVDACHALAAPLDAYLDETATQPSAQLQELEAATRELDWQEAFDTGQTSIELEQEMVSGALEGQFLKLLVALSGARRILEVGSFTGYASLAMAEALPPDGVLVACEYDEFAAEFARRHLQTSEAGRRVDIRVGDARETLRVLARPSRTDQVSSAHSSAGEPFDLAFIDADKPGYRTYYDTLLDTGLIPVGGIICVDNTLFQGQPYLADEQRDDNGRAIAAFNAYVAQDSRVEQLIVPLRDGVTVMRRVA